MIRLKQYQTLLIDDLEQQVYHLPRHNHNYYEIIYIYKGAGTHHLNERIFPYRDGDLFLIAPEDNHYFEIARNTRFIFIKFTDHYFSSRKYLTSDEFLMSDPGTIMRHKALKEIKLQLGDPCKKIIKNVVENILSYNSRKEAASSPIVFFQVLSILGLVKETLTKLNIHLTGSYPGKEQIISYIHLHIYEPEKFQIKSISTHFNIAPTYFSAYFKRHFGISYRQYINNIRKTLIEKRLQVGNLTLKEIAAEFGFTDPSHLSHFIKDKLAVDKLPVRHSLRPQ